MVGVDELELEANVYSGLAQSLAVGTVVEGQLDADTFTTEVRAVLPFENDRTRTRIVRFSVDAATSGLVPGQSVALRLPSGPSVSVLSVHKDAIIYRRGQPQVFVVDNDSAQPRDVRLGDGTGNRFEVLDGLTEGDLVIVRGNERIQPGQAVAVKSGD